MTDANTQIWLNCNGNTEGPFTEDDLARMRASGEISKYSWIWDSASKGWMAIQPLPPPPAAAPGAPTGPTGPGSNSATEFALTPGESIEDVEVEAKQHTPNPTKSISKSIVRNFPGANLGTEVTRSISAICHDNRDIVSGKIERVLGPDAFMKSQDYKESTPPFRKGGRLTVNLLDEASGQLENAIAEIADLKRVANGHWEYRLRWQAAPKLLANPQG